MSRMCCTTTVLLAAMMAVAGTVHGEGNAKRGAEVFIEECGVCHSSIPGKNKVGPTLSGINGRIAGSVPDFAGYSGAMKESGIMWTSEKLDLYIAAPKKVVPGNKMAYDGLADAGARADVIAYLLTLK